jgi:hypothetical protein
MRVRRPDHTGIALTPEVRLVGKASAAGQQPRILAPPNRLADPLRRDLLFEHATAAMRRRSWRYGWRDGKGRDLWNPLRTLGAVSIVIGS